MEVLYIDNVVSIIIFITKDTPKCRVFLAQLQEYVNYHMNVVQPPGPALQLKTVSLKTDMIIYPSLCFEVRKRIFIHVTMVTPLPIASIKSIMEIEWAKENAP